MRRERIGRIVEERNLPRIGRLVAMELHAELLRKGKRRGCEGEVKLILLKGRRAGSAYEATCMANAGYEAYGPGLVVPARLAEVIGLLPELPEGDGV